MFYFYRTIYFSLSLSESVYNLCNNGYCNSIEQIRFEKLVVAELVKKFSALY
jgi:hypothetical protein